MHHIELKNELSNYLLFFKSTNTVKTWLKDCSILNAKIFFLHLVEMLSKPGAAFKCTSVNNLASFSDKLSS